MFYGLKRLSTFTLIVAIITTCGMQAQTTREGHSTGEKKTIHLKIERPGNVLAQRLDGSVNFDELKSLNNGDVIIPSPYFTQIKKGEIKLELELGRELARRDYVWTFGSPGRSFLTLEERLKERGSGGGVRDLSASNANANINTEALLTLQNQFEIGLYYEQWVEDPFSSSSLQQKIEASKWYLRAASYGHAESQFRLGKAMESIGIIKGEEGHFLGLAADCYLKSAEQGNAEGQWAIGCAYEKGRGVPIDKTEAYAYMKIASDNPGSEGVFKGQFSKMTFSKETITAGEFRAKQLSEKIALKMMAQQKQVDADASISTEKPSGTTEIKR